MSVRTACKCNETDKQLQNVCVVDYKSNNDDNSTGILPLCCTGGMFIGQFQKNRNAMCLESEVLVCMFHW